MPSPASMSYTTLVEDIQKYSERPDDAALLAQIPRLVMLAENECAADLKVLGNALVVAAALTPGNAALAKPAFWRETVSFTIERPVQGRVTLQKRTLEYVSNFWPDRALTGVPRFYAEYNYTNFLIAPTPDAAYDMELVYYARLDPLSTSNTTNWLTQNAPQLLLYSCMYHTSLFLKNFDKADVWRGRYDTALASLKSEDASGVQDRSTVVS